MFVNITWADPNENGILGRFKRARLNSPTVTVDKVDVTLSTAQKNFAIAELKKLAKGKEILKENCCLINIPKNQGKKIPNFCPSI